MEIDAWTPGTSNIGSEGGGGIGFLCLCVMEREGKEGRTSPTVDFRCLPGVVCWAKPFRGFGKARLCHSGGGGRTPRQTNSSTKCQMRNVRSAVGWQRTGVTLEDFLEEVGLELSFKVKLCGE